MRNGAWRLQIGLGGAHGAPKIVNSDQSSQFTAEVYTKLFEGKGITVIMDGKWRAIDNIYIERFWRV